MRYAYYPGCSLRATAQEYDASTRALCDGLGIQLEEIPDWSCCGASASEPVSHLLTYVLPARNLALAQDMCNIEGVLVPCSACYLNLLRVAMETPTDPQLTQRINVVLAEEELVYERDTLPVLHLLQVLNEPGTLEQLKADTIQPLTGLRVAPYYGCQILRPYACFDDPEQPTSMQPLLHAVGAELYPWQMGNRCCGASLITTHREVALGDIGAILHAAQDADVIVTVCPMCQMNLEGFQKQALRGFQNDVHVPILYLPQLLGLAVGLTPEILQINKNLCAGPFHKGIG